MDGLAWRRREVPYHESLLDFTEMAPTPVKANWPVASSSRRAAGHGEQSFRNALRMACGNALATR
jgi:hypothetical protein